MRGGRLRWVFLIVLAACETEPTPSPTSRSALCEALKRQPPAIEQTQAFSIVVLPDTQFYAQRYPQIFQSQVAWIADRARDGSVAFALHEGDIVNDNVPDQWSVASAALHSLDAVVPYMLAAGNHDLALGLTGLTRTADRFNEHFPVAMHDDHLWFCGSYEEDDLQNTYALLEGGGRTWLVLALEFGPRDEVLEWANDVLGDYAAYPAWIVTHAYMYLGDQRYDHVGQPTQAYSPHAYGIEGTVNDGEEMWNALVAPNPNVQVVFSGHMLWPGVGRLTNYRADGSATHQVLANFQACDRAEGCVDPTNGQPILGGDGYLRVIDFNADHSQAAVKTYSTWLDRYKRDPDNEFTLPLRLALP